MPLSFSLTFSHCLFVCVSLCLKHKRESRLTPCINSFLQIFVAFFLLLRFKKKKISCIHFSNTCENLKYICQLYAVVVEYCLCECVG